jgi:hypothetical protein
MAMAQQGYEWALAPAFLQNSQSREAVFGYYGGTSTNMLNAAWQWSQTVADEWHFEPGPNDVSNSIAYATSVSNYAAIITALLATGAQVRVYSITPKTGWTATQRKQQARLNRWLHDYCRSVGGLLFVDAAAAVTDITTGEWPSGYNADAAHPSAPGAYAMALASVTAGLDAQMPMPYIASFGDVYDATYNPLGGLIGTAGYAVLNGTGGTQSASTGSAAAWAATTAYVVNQIVTASGNVYACTTAGTSGSTAPSHASGLATEGTVTWRYLGSGAGGLAAGWTSQLYSGAFAATNAKVARADVVNGTWQTNSVIFSGASGCQESVGVSATISTGLTALSPYELIAEMTILGAATLTAFGPRATPSGVTTWVCSALVGAVPDFVEPRKFVFRSPRYYPRTGTTAIKPEVLVGTSTTGAGKSAAWQVGRVSFRPLAA